MPLFEFACRSCGHQFEYLTRQNQEPTCPSCAGADLKKELSTFAVSTGGGREVSAESAGVGPCGACGDPRGPGACSMN
jgi:putative FmdB family regulatory protein